jgi:hypothetical protein
MIAKKSISRIFSVLFVIVFLLAGLPARPASAGVANYYVAKTGSDAGLNDCTDINDPCLTIAYAITQAVSFGTINIAAGTYIENLSVAKGLSLKGAGMNLTVLDGGGSGGVLYTNQAISIYDLTIQNGSYPTGDGGGIAFGNITATMTLTRVKVANNSAHHGAGINSIGPLVMTDSVVSGNHGTGVGGGLFLNQTGTASLTNVTVSGNESTLYGGGIHQQNGGTLNLTNVTISGNTSGDIGGALSTGSATVNILNTTIAGNHSVGSVPGGIVSYSATFNTKNAIVAGNDNDNCYFDISVTNNSLGNNLDSGNTCGFSQLTDLHSTNPNLGLLADNGGPTQTHALLPGSPAINAGTNTGCPTNDQRGITRPQPSGSTCDIGAYEYNYTGTYYVKQPATGTANCQSWDNACTLQAALTTAISGDEIWVKAGTHKPTSGSDRAATFQLKNGVAVYGGFAGAETLSSQRNPTVNVTILSGDLNGNDNSVVNIDEPTRADNSYHVVIGATGATLDGFTITAGNASINPYPLFAGGGMLNLPDSSPTLVNLTFSGNSAASGGGMLNDSSSPMLTDVTFSGNSVSMDGGGMYNIASSNPILTNVTFSGNSASSWGGGMFNILSSPTLTNVTFSGNSAHNGGGMRNFTSSPTLTNVTFSGNSAIGTNSTGGGLDNTFGGSPQIRNTIFWGNTAVTAGAQINNDSGIPVPTPSVTDSVVQGGYVGGTNIIVTDPLLGTLGNYGGLTQTIPLLLGSSAIDALITGTNGCGTFITSDQRGVARPQGAKCDIGAFEQDDFTAPTVNTFTVTTPSNSLIISITAFSATDNIAVTGYLITGSATVPAAGAIGWTATPPTTYTVVSDGSYTLYPWAKDATGNVSAVFGSPRTVLVDTTKPVVNTFTATTPSNSLNIPITAFTATDAGGLAGYMITTSAAAPAAGVTGWTATAPTTYTVVSDGTYTLYPWAKDTTGNVSAVFDMPRTVVVDTISRIYLPLVMR